MTTQKPIVRTYRLTDGDLIQKTNFIAMMVERDAAQFATRNITNTLAMQAAREAFVEVPTDSFWSGLVIDAADNRDAALNAVREDIIALRNMAERAFKGRPAIYKTFGFARFSALGDNDAYRTARLMAKLALLHKTALAAKGLTDAWLETFNAHIAAFDESLDALRLAEAVRVQKTEERIILGNALYAELSELCSVGQSLFIATNEALYNDYLLESSGG